MTGSLLDTSVLIARDESGALGLPEAAAISVISLGELRAGVQMARDERVAELRRGRLAAVRAAFAPLLVDEAVAERYGDVLAVAFHPEIAGETRLHELFLERIASG